jgi:tetratricopeptide (TPR) repeat protein
MFSLTDNPSIRCKVLLAVCWISISLIVTHASESCASSDSVRNMEQPLQAAHSSQDWQWLLSASLAAGGIDSDQEIDQLCQEFVNLCEEGRTEFHGVSDEHKRAVQLFSLLHRECLTGSYEQGCWRVDATLHHGPYNCVTSTILYICLARYHGLSVTALATPTHVYCQLDGEPPQEIQTTCLEWFERPHNRRRQTTTSTAGPSDIAEPNHEKTSTPVRLLSDKQLVGKVLYNRAIELLHKERFATAVEFLQQARELDPDDQTARKNLVAALNNWALWLASQGDYAGAMGRLQLAESLTSDTQFLLNNRLFVQQQWISTLCEQQKYKEAVSHFVSASARFSHDERLRKWGRQFWQDCLHDLHGRRHAPIANQLQRQLKSGGFDLTSDVF